MSFAEIFFRYLLFVEELDVDDSDIAEHKRERRDDNACDILQELVRYQLSH